ncbi:MAG: GAF domain-containing sensor histidine kinase [Desulfobacterales bacterium]
MTDRTATAKSRTRQLDDLEKRHRAMAELVDKIEHLIRFQEKIDKPGDLMPIWQVFVEEVRHHLEVSVTGLVLVDPDSREFRLSQCFPEHQFAGCRQELDAQIECRTFAWVIGRKRPSVIPSLVLNPGQTLVLMPLAAGGRTLGVVMLLTPLKDHSVTREKLKVLTILGKQCALAMDNARLYADLQQKHENLLKVQDQVIQAEKFAALGRTTSRIFHELLNPLQVITGGVDLLRIHGEARPELHELLEVIQQNSNQMAGVIKSLMEFSSIGRNAFRVVDILELLKALMQEPFHAGVEQPVVVGFRVLTTRRRVKGDPDRLLRTFRKIVANSLDAMSNGGFLHIELVESEGVHGLSQTRRYIGIRFSDTGSGISEQHLRSIFDPFFTTKPFGKGLGINLALGYAAVRSMEGTITVASRPGHGTIFTVHLPECDDIS